MGDKSGHGSCELLKLKRSQEAEDLVDYVQTHSLSGFVPEWRKDSSVTVTVTAKCPKDKRASAWVRHLWLIIWTKPDVFSCMNTSGITSARLNTHSKQSVFKTPCSFGSMKNTWFIKLWKNEQDTKVDYIKINNELIYAAGKRMNSPIHKGREVFGHFIQANYELVIQVFFLQVRYLTRS